MERSKATIVSQDAIAAGERVHVGHAGATELKNGRHYPVLPELACVQNGHFLLRCTHLFKACIPDG